MSPAVLLAATVLGASPAQVHTSTTEVHACAFADDGAVLAATAGGLAVVGTDGGTRVLTSLDGLPGTQSHALLQTDEGDWWVGTERGVARVSGETLEVLETIEGPAARALALDDGGLLVGTWGEGVMRRQGGSLRALPYDGATSGGAARRITALQQFDGGWVVGTAGAGLWSLRGDRLQRRDQAPADAIVWSLAADGEDLWVGTLEGVFRGSDSMRRASIVDARGLALHGDAVTVATLGDGIVRLDRTSGTQTAVEASVGVTVRGIAHEGERRCVATDAGLQLDRGPGTASRRALADGLVSGDISALALDDATGDVWVGTFDRGLMVRRGTDWHTIEDARLDPQINALAVQPVEGRSVVWAATARGLSRIEDGAVRTFGRKSKMPHEHVFSVHVRDDGTVVAGTARGFVTITDGVVTKPPRKRLAERWAIWSIAEDAEGTLWFGTTKGLIAWPEEGPWRRYSMLDGTLPDNWVTSVRIGADGLWVGTYAGGVTKLTREADGGLTPAVLGGGRINPGGLTLTASHVYAATMGGLLRRPRTTAGNWTALRDHSPGKDTKAVLPTAHGVWVASRRGMALST
ncbi:MAG: two-component regulator propeller domain-containing protein [Myxococcota bacterium]